MPTITVVTDIAAPMQVCFDLARDVEIHTQTTTSTGEQVIGGFRSGLLGLGDTVTFMGRHFGVWMRLTARINVFEPPERFIDDMIAGPVQSLRHIHAFEPLPEGTRMTDTLIWKAGYGVFSPFADLVIGPHMRRLLTERNQVLKRLAETAQASEALPDS